MDKTIYTPESLFQTIKTRIMLAALAGDFSWSTASRLSHLVWDKAPAFFPDYADMLNEHGPMAAFWTMREIASEIPGGWDLWVAMRDALGHLTGEWI